MADSIEERLQKLEEEILRLRSRQKSLFNIVDTSTDKEPFMRLRISVDATEEQETAIYDLMNEVDEQIT
jgi:predicted  nucleic acid-binding Zn-ribbon protein